MNTSVRRFRNEIGNHITIVVEAQKPHADGLCMVLMRGPKSQIENQMTRMEMENLRDALTEALAHGGAGYDPMTDDPRIRHQAKGA